MVRRTRCGLLLPRQYSVHNHRVACVRLIAHDRSLVQRVHGVLLHPP